MNLILIYGYPGTGKLTVAKELQKLTDYRLFHNHLAVDLASSIFPFGSQPFIEFREELWLRTFELGILNGLNGMIFTFAFEKTVQADFIDRVNTLFKHSSQPSFVELRCDPDTLKRRVEEPDRQKYNKFQSYEKLKGLIEAKTYYEPSLPTEILRIDNTNMDPVDVAKEIATFYHL